MIVTYILFAIGIFTGGFITIIGLVLAYIKRKDVVGTIYHDHLTYLIRTFWISVIGSILSFILLFILIGYLGFILLSLWYIFRIVYGLIQLLNKQPVTATGWFM
ncbi:hypothetical protein A6A11_01770 [Bisgaardia hudsonensis]|nr:hypothetical protein A6A11_01770 [Bisgaardia hudsonensis]